MKPLLALLCLLLAACATTPQRLPAPSERMPAKAENGGTLHLDARAMLAAHNRWRAGIGVPPLRWSNKLAGVAAAYAERLAARGCAMQHSRNRYGENLFWASPLRWSDGRVEVQRISEAYVVDAWGSERKDFDYRRNRCSGTCGHYTQLIWSSTREVGCAARVCANRAQIWVCNYDPPGNIVGRRPY